MQSVSSRFWIRVAVSISYNYNQYATGTSVFTYICSEVVAFSVESIRGVVGHLLGFDIAVSEFELSSS